MCHAANAMPSPITRDEKGCGGNGLHLTLSRVGAGSSQDSMLHYSVFLSLWFCNRRFGCCPFLEFPSFSFSVMFRFMTTCDVAYVSRCWEKLRRTFSDKS